MLLPGAGDVRAEYRQVVPLLQAAGCRVVTMDLRGHGASSAAWPSYGVADTAADLLALLAHLNAGPAWVVGTSFAPAAALWAAAAAWRSTEPVIAVLRGFDLRGDEAIHAARMLRPRCTALSASSSPAGSASTPTSIPRTAGSPSGLWMRYT